MPLSDIAGQLGSLQQKRFTLDDFSGGLQLAGRIEDIPTKFLLKATNVDLRSGRLRARPPYKLMAGTPAFRFTWGFYSQLFNYLYIVSESDSKLYRSQQPDGGAWTDVKGALPSFALGCDFLEFNGAIICVTPSGVYASTDGTTWTLQTAVVTGVMIAAWQNKLFVAGDSTNKTRLWWSNPGSYSTWTTATDWVDVREGEAEAPITALHSTTEMDYTGRPSLLAFKQRSVHRVNSASTGAYSTLNRDAGAIGKRAVYSSYGVTAFIAESGIYATNGVSPAVEIGGPIRPLPAYGGAVITPSTGEYANVVASGPRFIFSFPGPGASSHDGVHLEWDAESKAWVRHTFAGHTNGIPGWAIAPAGTLIGDNTKPWLLSFDVSNPSKMFRMFNDADIAADDGGVAATATVQTPFIQLAGGTRFRIHRIRLSGVFPRATTLTLRVRYDGATADSVVRSAAGINAAGKLQDIDFNRLGSGRNVSLVLETPVNAVGAAVYRTDTIPFDRTEIVRLLIEYTPIGLN